MKTRLLKFRSYASVSIVAIDTTNPLNVFYAAKRIVQNYKSLDVLYLNNSTIRIDHFNWDVLKKALKTLRLPYFCQQVLSPFILVMELTDLLKEATLPGRIVWTGSSTCR